MDAQEFSIRNVPFEVDRATPDGDGLTLEGYAAVFDSPTEINSRGEGHFIERIKPGAFKRSLDHHMPVLMFNHGQHPLIGDMPIGVIQHAREDAQGLFVRARLAGNWLIAPVREAIEQGAVNGMSFRFSVPKDGEVWRRGIAGGLKERDVTQLKCMELGPVVFPAYPETTVGVRSLELPDADRLAEALAKVSFRAPGDSDEDPVMLAQAVDAVLDSLQIAFASGDIAQAQDLLTAAETSIDELIELLGGVDADDMDTPGDGPADTGTPSMGPVNMNSADPPIPRHSGSDPQAARRARARRVTAQYRGVSV